MSHSFASVALPAELTIAPSSKRRQLWMMAVLSALMGFASISTDVYLPALPHMAAALHARGGTVEWTVGGFLVGFSLGQLLWGPIGDRFGRRLPVAAGLVLFIIGSAGCATATGVWTMVAWRIVQAVGACAGVVLARAMVRDLYANERAAQMLSTLITIMAIAPLVGPLVGGQILLVGSWRMIFWLLVAVGVLTLAALFTIPETLPAGRRSHESLAQALRAYAALLRDSRLLGYAFVGGLFYIGIYAYISGSPFAYITYYQVPAQLYGLLFGASIAGIMVANMLNVRFVSRVGIDRMLGFGVMGVALAGVTAGVDSLTGWGGLAGLVIPLCVYCAMSGFIVANTIAGALSRHPDRAGAVSALVGAIHYGVGIAGSGLVGWFVDGTPRPLGLVVAASGVASLLCCRLLLRAPRGNVAAGQQR